MKPLVRFRELLPQRRDRRGWLLELDEFTHVERLRPHRPQPWPLRRRQDVQLPRPPGDLRDDSWADPRRSGTRPPVPKSAVHQPVASGSGDPSREPDALAGHDFRSTARNDPLQVRPRVHRGEHLSVQGQPILPSCDTKAGRAARKLAKASV